MPFNLPIFLTWLRIVLIPLMVCIYYLPPSWLFGISPDTAAMLVFVIAGITDWFDGFLARHLNQTSSFGAFLDPVADKLVVAAALVMLVQLSRVDAIIAIIIIGREIAISALREWMASIGARVSVAVSMIGKIKTTAQMGAITLLLYNESIFKIDTHFWGTILVYIAAVLTLWSMIYYIYKALPHLKEK